MKCNQYLLGDVCNFIDYRGKTPPKQNFGIPLITAKIVKNGTILPPTEFISEEYYDEWMRRGIPKKGAVIFTTEAPLGEVAQINTSEKLAFAQRVIILEPKEEILSPDYLLFALQEGLLKSRIQSRASGTTVVGIKSSELKKVVIDLPDLSTQRRIAAILSSLDAKIELNNKINANLQQQAQALFKSFYENSRKEVPFTDLVDILGGGTPKTGESSYWNGKVPFFTPKDASDLYAIITEKTLTEEGLFHCNSQLYPKNTVFVTARGTVGKIALAGVPMAMNQSCYALAGKNIKQLLVYFYTSQVIKSLKNKASGSVFDAITTKDFYSEKVYVLDEIAEKEFCLYAEPVMELILQNGFQNLRLAELRDTLLPKLMSGELDVSDIELSEVSDA
ncbi:restriction endonuclease subunit S [Mailhella sp.]